MQKQLGSFKISASTHPLTCIRVTCWTQECTLLEQKLVWAISTWHIHFLVHNFYQTNLTLLNLCNYRTDLYKISERCYVEYMILKPLKERWQQVFSKNTIVSPLLENGTKSLTVYERCHQSLCSDYVHSTASSPMIRTTSSTIKFVNLHPNSTYINFYNSLTWFRIQPTDGVSDCKMRSVKALWTSYLHVVM